MPNLCKINGIDFDARVSITAFEETINVLDGENAGRVLNGRMVRDIIGTYIGHKVTFFSGKSRKAFDELYDYLIAHTVDDSVMVEMAHGQTMISYEAYYTVGGVKLLEQQPDGYNRWEEFEVTFVPMEAKLKP